MSDWKSRATPVKEAAAPDWKSRATPADAAQPGVDAIGNTDGPTPAAEQTLKSKLENTLAGYGNGALAGYLPQINGGIQAAGNMLMGNEPNYVGERDAEIARLKKAGEQNPYLYNGAKIGGTVAGALLLPAGNMANAGRVAKVATAAGVGGALGAVQNPGDKEGVIDPLQMQPRLKNAAVGAATGGLLNMGGQAVAEYAPGVLKSIAGTQAFKALGPYARDARRALSRGEVADIGNTALDEGVVGGMPTSFGKIAERASEAKAARGQEIGDLLGKISEKEGAPTISRKEIADQLRNELIEPHTDVASIASKNDTLTKAIDHFEQGGNEHLPLLEAEMKKRALDQNINWKRLPQDDVPVGEQMDKALRGKLAQEVEDKAVASSPDEAAKFLAAKKAYGGLDKAETISKARQGHEMAKQLLAPSVGGVVGFTRGNSLEERIKNALLGIAGGAAIRGGSLYGPQILAPLARGAANLAPKAANINPWLAPALATQGGQP